MEEILRCGFIVYDITQDNEEIVKVERILKAIKKHLKKIEEIGPKTYEKYTDRRVFILLSTVMTWAKTKSTDSVNKTHSVTILLIFCSFAVCALF